MTSLNLMDVDILVNKFLQERQQGINSLHRIYYKNNNEVSLKSLQEELKEELKTGCSTFLNKNFPLEEINDYLFYIVNDYCKKNSRINFKSKNEYICPGCLFLGKDNIIYFNDIFKCSECEIGFKNILDPKQKYFFEAFYRHNKKGYHCPECKKFIPHPLNNSEIVSCPYFNCLFVGSINDMDMMHHPSFKYNPERLILDKSTFIKDNISSQELDVYSKIELADDLQNKIKIINDVIETQYNNIPYSSSELTAYHKQFSYQAFSILLKKYPEDMVNYLLQLNNHHMGFQHKLFQEYINLLEASFPIFIMKNKKNYKIDSLLDEHLCLFDGISVFETIVDEKIRIKNKTKEFYIGGRKASLTKPFYIGKLLNVIESKTKVSLMHLVKEYSFSQINMIGVNPGTPVIITHLRIPPHHQMGGMVYINRIRKKIIDKSLMMINKNAI